MWIVEFKLGYKSSWCFVTEKKTFSYYNLGNGVFISGVIKAVS